MGRILRTQWYWQPTENLFSLPGQLLGSLTSLSIHRRTASLIILLIELFYVVFRETNGDILITVQPDVHVIFQTLTIRFNKIDIEGLDQNIYIYKVVFIFPSKPGFTN